MSLHTNLLRSGLLAVAFSFAALMPASDAAAQLPRVLIITTGGTLGLPGTELTQAVPQLAQIADCLPLGHQPSWIAMLARLFH